MTDTLYDWAADSTPFQHMDLPEILERYELVDVNIDTGVVMVSENWAPSASELVERNSSAQLSQPGPAIADMRELGSTGTSMYSNMIRQDYKAELRGQLGYRVYDQMRRSDARVRSSLRAVKTPILAARWFMEPYKQSDGSIRPKDQMIADFVWCNLTEWMSITWEQVLFESMLHLDFGYYMFEKVWSPYVYKGQPRIIIQKLAPRHPMDVIQWYYDANGGPNAVRMYELEHAFNYTGVIIPIDKLLVFTHDKEAGNMEGISLLRSAYKHWYYKENLYKIDAIQKERHGIGVPVIKLPPGFTPSDKQLADELGRNLRTNEKAHVLLPPNWEMTFAPLQGQPVDAIASIEHHDNAIDANILASFLKGEGTGDVQDLFMKSCRFTVENIRGVHNKYLIPQLVNYNWPNIDGYPVLRARRVGDTLDWRAISFAIRNFVGAGILIPDDGLEEWVRDEMDMPAVDTDTARIIPGLPPQSPALAARGSAPTAPEPPKVGLPRQSQAGNMRSAKTPGSKQVGQDGSGG